MPVTEKLTTFIGNLSVLGGSLNYQGEPTISQPETIDVPSLNRPRVLMYLLTGLGKLDHSSIIDLAAEFKVDAENENYRPLGNIIRDIIGNRPLFKRDPFLNFVALSYDMSELTIEIDPDQSLPPNKDGSPLRLVDSLVGDGPSRPLLYDLYSLEGLVGLANCEEREGKGLFYPTYRAVAWTKTLQLIFEGLEPKMKRNGSMVIVEKHSQRLANTIQ